MSRGMAAVFATLLYFSSAHASLDCKDRSEQDRLLPVKSLLSSARSSGTNDDFRITEKTEVLLDGRPCRYEQVPNGATIILLETVTNESKEISRIHFRSPRRAVSSPSK
jgi:hypothetical protein